MGTPLIIGRGNIGSRLAALTNGTAVGSDVDITTDGGRRFVADHEAEEVWVGVRPGPEVEHVEMFYAGAATLAPMLAAAGKKVILLSSCMVYGRAMLASETDKLAPVESYGRAKLVEETLYRAVFESRGLLVVRIFDTYGHDSGVVHAFQKFLKEGTTPKIAEDIVMDLMHLDDVAALLVRLATVWKEDSCPADVVNLGTGLGTRIVDLWQRMGGKEWEKGPSHRAACVADTTRLQYQVGFDRLKDASDRLDAYLEGTDDR